MCLIYSYCSKVLMYIIFKMKLFQTFSNIIVLNKENNIHKAKLKYNNQHIQYIINKKSEKYLFIHFMSIYGHVLHEYNMNQIIEKLSIFLSKAQYSIYILGLYMDISYKLNKIQILNNCPYSLVKPSIVFKYQVYIWIFLINLI